MIETSNDDFRILAKKINLWKESFETLDDEQFFAIMRIYLGEIKTPYNKQNLVDKLTSFIHLEENQNVLIKMLSSADIKIIAVIIFIREATFEKLEQFFLSAEEKNTGSTRKLSDNLQNLKERLILFEYEKSGKKIIAINPLLENKFNELVSLEAIFPREESSDFSENEESTIFLNASYIASFITYVESHPDLCKNNGELKKKANSDLEQIYGKSWEKLSLLTRALLGLSIFQEQEKGIFVDNKRLALFAKLPRSVQYAYICAASCGHFSRSSLQCYAQDLLDTLCSLPNYGLTREEILQFSFLVKERAGSKRANSESRFSKILTQAESGTNVDKNASSFLLMESMLDAASAFGLLQEKTKRKDGKPLFCAWSGLCDSEETPSLENLVSIDASCSVTILPGFDLQNLLTLTPFMTIQHFDTAAVFEIDRQSVRRAFDSGFDPQKICTLLESYTSYGVPQNLRIRLEEWFAVYSSASLYNGYVLKVSPELSERTKNNPLLSRHIREILAEGIFLLDFTNAEQAQNVISKSGLDFIGNVKTSTANTDVLPLPTIRFENAHLFPEKKGTVCAFDLQFRKNLQHSLVSELESIEMSPEQREGLLERIENCLVLNKNQLCASSVPFEKLEASGMDYLGKIHLIERAIQNHSLLEIEMKSLNTFLVGYPLVLNKKGGNATVEFEVAANGSHQLVFVGSASRIRKIRRVSCPE